VEGGPSTFYARAFIEKKENFILLTGYQANGTRGRALFDDHVFFEKGVPIPAQCHIRKFSFSAHLDRRALHRFIEAVDHKDLILQHGDPDALDALASFAQGHLSSRVHTPQIGEVMNV
jgi:metallo-beta-lactamase family protein